MKTIKMLNVICISLLLVHYTHAQIIYTLAGNGTAGFSGDGGFAASAKLDSPEGVFVDGSGNVYESDGLNNRVRKINTSGIINTIIGNGTGGYSGDGGAATAAEIYDPAGIYIDNSGNIYLCDPGNHRVREINTSGIISTIIGNGTAGYSGDGSAATTAEIWAPGCITMDASGNLYVSDEFDAVIRKVNTSGIISTYAGNGTEGFSGDGGAATSAKLNSPAGITFDGLGNLFIADYTNDRIRKVNTSGIISTYAGNGTAGFSGDGGAATAAELKAPTCIVLDASGNMYITDSYNYRIRKINTSGIISTYAGNGTSGFSGDGALATSAELVYPWGVAIGVNNSIYISDINNNRIRVITTVCPANAGPNVTDFQGCCFTWPGVEIGTPAVPNMTYAWSPSTVLSSTTTAQPTSTWTNTASPETYTVTVSNANCTTNTSTVQVSAHSYSGSHCCRLINPEDTGIQASVPINFSVYPNPVNNNVTISICNHADYVRIIDLTGKIILEKQNVIAGELKINVSTYVKGIYIVAVKMGNKIENQKMIVE